MVHGLQGIFRAWRSDAMPPANDHRRRLALPDSLRGSDGRNDRTRTPALRARVCGVWRPSEDPQRQWVALRDQDVGRAVGAERVVDPAGDCSRAHRAWAATTKRAARAISPDAQSLHDETAGSNARRAAACLRPLPARLQRRAPARSARSETARIDLRAVMESAASAARARVWRGLQGPTRW